MANGGGTVTIFAAIAAGSNLRMATTATDRAGAGSRWAAKSWGVFLVAARVADVTAPARTRDPASQAEQAVAVAVAVASVPTRKPLLLRAELWCAMFACCLVLLEANLRLLEPLFVWRAVSDMNFEVGPGSSGAVRFPHSGPYDERLGYVALPAMIQRLEARNFEVERQARQSRALLDFIEAGGYAVYHEKSQAGLLVKDRWNRPLDAAPYPSTIYARFEDIPPILVDTLRFIEDRELLDGRDPYRNPAIEWHRFALAAAGRVAGVLDADLRRGGASTLATQLEKYRHSPDGRTDDISEKVRQMVTATARAYLDGPRTSEAQRRIVTSYFDSTPLGARPGYGEIIGLGDGMRAWFGVDLREANELLGKPAATSVEGRLRAHVYKQALSLLIAQRRPSYYLNGGRADLERLTDGYLRGLAGAGIIDRGMLRAALSQPLAFAPAAPSVPADSFVERKAVDSIRLRLKTLLGLPEMYSLDHLDLSAQTSIDGLAQRQVAAVLKSLSDPRQVKALGLVGDQLLGSGLDPGKVAWSVAVYERGNGHNLVRVHADSLNRPFDINSEAKLMLGSTAKLRTLATYLGIIETLHQELAEAPAARLKQMAASREDPLRAWAAGYLLAASDDGQRSLTSMLQAALQRRYSASPAESFLTGGGIHVFHNFERSEDRQRPTVEDAFEHSVNLAFVRLMRDVIAHYEAEFGARDEVLEAPDSALRGQMLQRFADREGTVYLNRFYSDYAGASPDEALELLTGAARDSPRRLAVMFRSVRPDASPDTLRAFLARHLRELPPDRELARMYETSGPDRLSLIDRAYLARVHPLELWLVQYLQHEPKASRQQAIAASARERQESYTWLFKTKNLREQNVRIRGLVEQGAFERLLQDWRRQGYPFNHIVPSLATAIGSSGDRPDALADLMGTILNGGERQATVDLERLHFAADTPYETEMAYRAAPPQRVMSASVAAVLRKAMSGVVQRGTAVRVRGVFAGPDGVPIAVGGKTGTGDNRFESFGPGHHLLSDRPVDRTATFVFFLGDRMYGTVVAYVSGPQAGQYHFTSALAVTLLKALAPQLHPLLEHSADRLAGQAQPAG